MQTSRLRRNLASSVLAALVFASALSTARPIARAVPADFVYREGTRLMINGQQYKFAGINADTWFGCWANEVPTDEQLDRFFRELNPRSMTRVWIMPGASLSIMDRIVAKADQYNQYLAPVLGNGNADCDSIGAKTSDWYANGFRNTYHSHVRSVVERYKNSRAIGLWEMINEPKGSEPSLKEFYRDTSDLIKSIDPNHLVGSGSHAAWSSGSTANYIDQHDVPNVDLISVHEYDDRSFHWADEARTAAQRLNKPFYVGEDGFCCGGGPSGSWEQNAKILTAEFDTYLTQYSECVGMLYWDFKLGYPGAGATINFGDAGWTVMRTYANPYRGGSSAAAVTPAAPSGLSAVLSGGGAVDLHWTDNADNETDFKVERRIGATGSYVQIGMGGANTVNFHDSALSASTTYYYRVRAHNAGGDSPYAVEVSVTTSGSVNTTINDNTLGTALNQFEYVGAWQYWSGEPSKYQGDDHYATAAGTSANFRFSGAQLRYYAKRAPHHGIVAVSIDGGAETEIDLYAPTATEQVQVYSSPIVSRAPHVFTLRVTGKTNASAGGATVTIDKIDVLLSNAPASSDLQPSRPGANGSAGAGAAPTVVNDSATGGGIDQFQYTGTWQVWTGDASKYQGDDHYSSTVDAVATLKFDGTQLRYYAKKASHHGIMAVSIDGEAEQDADLYARQAGDQLVVFTSQVLSAGLHTLRLRVTGRKNGNSSGTMVTIDRVDVTP